MNALTITLIGAAVWLGLRNRKTASAEAGSSTEDYTTVDADNAIDTEAEDVTETETEEGKTYNPTDVTRASVTTSTVKPVVNFHANGDFVLDKESGTISGSVILSYANASETMPDITLYAMKANLDAYYDVVTKTQLSQNLVQDIQDPLLRKKRQAELAAGDYWPEHLLTENLGGVKLSNDYRSVKVAVKFALSDIPAQLAGLDVYILSQILGVYFVWQMSGTQYVSGTYDVQLNEW